MTGTPRQPIWTRTYAALCAAQGLGFAHQGLLLPTTALYVTNLGGSPLVVGLVLLSFSVPSFTLRPLLGYRADTRGAAAVLTAGALLLGLCGLLYLVPLLLAVWLVSVARGIGWAGFNTGGYAMLAHVAPPDRRGEASGYYTAVQGGAAILFPALALRLVDGPGGFRAVFLIAGVLALAAAAIGQAALRPADRTEPAASGAAPAQPGFATILDRGVLLATALQLCAVLPSPAVQSFMPLYARERGIEDIGLFYIVSGAVNLAIRPLLGRASDRLGRGSSIAAGFCCQAAGFLLIMAAPGLGVILLGGALNALGTAVTGAAATALAMDLADPRRRGAAMATFSMAFQMGAGFGGVLAGGLVSLSGYRAMFAGAAAIAAAGLLLTALNRAPLARAARPAVATSAPRADRAG